MSPTPGTTRDFISELIALGGYPVELVDTAGLRRHGGVVEMKGVEATWGVVSEADIVVIVADGARPMTSSERELLDALLSTDPILAVNKSDVADADRGWQLVAGPAICEISALTGEGLPLLTRTILGRLPDPAAYPPGCAVALNPAQAEALRSAREHCISGRTAAAACALAGMVE